MDGVQLPQGLSHFEEAVYFLPLSSQKFLGLLPTSISRPYCQDLQEKESMYCIGATNIEDCFVGRTEQRGSIPNRGATVNTFGQDNHR